MNAAEQENARNATREAVEREYEEVPKRCWEMQYRHKDVPNMPWLRHCSMLHLDEEVRYTLKYLRAKYPERFFRAVKTVHVSYTRTIVRS